MNVIEGNLNIAEFSELIGKSYRQSQRIIKKVCEKGELGIIHGNVGRVPVNKTDPNLLADINILLRSKYYDFNLVHFNEMLKENEGIIIKYSTLYGEAKNKKLIKHEKRRSKKKYSTRPRLPSEGMLVQLDGSEHLWFGGFKSDLIAGIDDATGKILWAEFFIGETSLNSMKVIKEIIKANGVPPGAFYMDEAAIYGKKDRDWESQIKRALETLNCKLILASSPQAKGRVERLFRTLQDRLIAELRLGNIKSIPQANAYLKETFIPKFNKMFSVQARSSKTSYQEVDGHENIDLVLCRKESRKITAGNTFSYRGETYLLKGNRNYQFRTININTYYDGPINYDIVGKIVEVQIFLKKEDKIKEVA